MKPTKPPLQIAKPCSMDWNDMSGDARKRFCAGCQKHVFNLSAMTEGEARAFAEETQGRECIAYAPAEDGRIHTPNRFERGLIWISGRLPRMAAMLAILLPATLAASVERLTGKPVPPKDPPVRDGGEKGGPPMKLGEPTAREVEMAKGKVVAAPKAPPKQPTGPVTAGIPCRPEKPPEKPEKK